MQGHDMIVIGSSAGGVAALKELLQTFPKDTAASFFIVQHLAPDAKSILASILGKATEIPVIVPKDLEPVKIGHIYLAPPDHHMVIKDDRILVRRGPKENRFRPSIDVTMRSLAYAYDGRVTGIILTGRLGDGSSGLWTIKEMGGTGIVQDPADALFPDMPDNALKAVQADHILPLKEIGPMVKKHIGRPVTSRTGHNPPVHRRMEAEIDIAAQENAFEKGVVNMGEKTSLTCPECGGALTGIREGITFRYRCHTGHAFSADALWAGVIEGTETHLWQAMRSMEEAIILLEQAATESSHSGNQPDSDRFQKRAEHLRLRSRRLLDLIYENNGQNDVTE
jgi:two-component system, chemotaxis family, protein-glutamate methylesterase/glutaminase